jgi:hypothetical protein
MSTGSRLFLKRIRLVDFGIEPSTCSMQPNPSRSGRTPEYTARIRSTQSVPCRQHEQLSVPFGEGPKAGEGDEAVFVGGFLGLINHRKTIGDAGSQIIPSPKPPVVVGEDVASRHVQPQNVIGTARDLVQLPPGNLEDVSHDVGGIFSGCCSTENVSSDLGARRFVDRAEALLIRL